MHKILALTGISQAQMQSYETSLLQMAPALDQTPTALAQGLYYVISAGYSGAEALQILSYSAKAAAAGMTNMDQVSDVLTSAMNTFKTQGVSAGHAIDDIMAAVTYGKIQLTTLATGFSFVGVQAANAGFNIDETSAAVSALSQVAGNRAGRRTMMDLSNLMRQLGMRDIAPVVKSLKLTTDQFNLLQYAGMSFEDKVKYIASAVGLTATSLDQMRAQAKGNIDVFQQLAYAHMKSAGAFLKLVGGAAAALPAMMLLQDNFKSYDQILLKMGGDGSNTAAAFDKIRESTGQKMNMVKVAIESILTVIGLQLLPIVNQVLDAVYKLGQGILNLLTSATNGAQAISNLKYALLGIALVVASILLPVIISAVGALFTFLLPVAAVVAGGILLGKVIQAVVAHFGGWAGVAKQLHPLLLLLQGAFKQVGDAIKQGISNPQIQAAWKQLQAALPEILPLLKALAIVVGVVLVVGFKIFMLQLTLFFKALPVVINIVTVVIHVLGLLGTFLMALFSGRVFAAIGDALGNLFGLIGNFFTKTIPDTIKAGAKAALDALTFPFREMGKLFVWLYNHNTYIKRIVDGFIITFNALKNFLGTALKGVELVLTNAWTNIQKGAEIAWAWIGAHIIKPVQDAIAWFMSVGARVQAAIHDHVTQPIADAISNLVKTAESWGENLLKMFIQGMKNQLGALGNAAKSVLSTVGGWLGFHSPAPKVPESAQWGPNLIKMFAQGMVSASPTAGAAAQAVLARVAQQLAGRGGGGSAGGLGGMAGTITNNGSLGSLAGALGGAGGVTNVTHNWSGAFPNATSKDEIVAAIRQVQQTDYRAARRPGSYGGLSAHTARY